MNTFEKSPKHDWEELKNQFIKYQAGCNESARLLFESLQRPLHSFFRVRLKSQSESEDLLQITLLKIHFARESFDSTKSLKTWVFTIASRSLIDHWRESGREQDRDIDKDDGIVIEELTSREIDFAYKFELTNDINEAMKRLKPTERSIVYLYGVEGFSMAEIAGILNSSEGATKARAHRAYKELRKHLIAIIVIWINIRNL